MFAINGTFVIFCALFLVFMVLLNEVFLKPVGQVIEQRKAKIDKAYSEANNSNAEGDAAMARYHEHLHTARLEAQSIIAQSLKVAEQARHEKLQATKRTGVTKLEQIKKDLGEERKKLLDGLVDFERDLVKNITEKIMGVTPSALPQPDAIKRMLEEAH